MMDKQAKLKGLSE